MLGSFCANLNMLRVAVLEGVVLASKDEFWYFLLLLEALAACNFKKARLQ